MKKMKYTRTGPILKAGGEGEFTHLQKKCCFFPNELKICFLETYFLLSLKSKLQISSEASLISSNVCLICNNNKKKTLGFRFPIINSK